MVKDEAKRPEKTGCEMVKIQARGQITLPSCMRQKLGIEPESWLLLYLEDNKIVIKKIDEEKLK